MIDVRERRTRLVARHLLDPMAPAPDVETVADRLVALHATDPASTFLAVRARMAGFTVAHLEDALYERSTVVKHLCMRRTLFVVAAERLAVVQAACTDTIAVVERRRLLDDLSRSGAVADGERWLSDASRATLAAVDELGEASGTQLSQTVPALRTKLQGTGPAGERVEVGVTTRVLTVLAAEGRIVRGRPNGSWTSSQHRWRRHEPGDPMAAENARTALVRAWLGAFGPAPVEDLAWWTGLGLTKIRSALAAVGAVAVAIEDGTGTVGDGYVLPEDVDRAAEVGPSAAFLPALDPTTMGWKRRDWYLGPHGPDLFDRSGNAGPTIWWDGRVVGGWSQRRSGEVAHALLEDVGAEAVAAVEREADVLQRWLGGTVVTTRFPTPLDRRLRA